MISDEMPIMATTILSFVFLLLIGVNAKETLRLKLGALISQRGSFDFTGLIPAMNIALETIENDTTLPFKFDVVINDSMVSYIATIHACMVN